MHRFIALVLFNALAWGGVSASANSAAPLATVPAQAMDTGPAQGFDGVVEAVRQTQIAAQVAGSVVELAVRAGQQVVAGQVLVRIDARGAEQGAAASAAQVQAAQAALAVAEQEFARQQQLFVQKFISAAALERAEGQLKAARAQMQAQSAQAGAARTQTSLHTLRAPYAGTVADVPVQLGDMALPGRTLLTLYDPTALRVVAALPQSVVAGRGTPALGTASVRIELPGRAGADPVQATRVQLLPTVDAATHTQQLRADLPTGTPNLAPGQFARVWLLDTSAAPQAAQRVRVSVPLSAVVRRGEMTGIYVQGPSQQLLLRQVRLGPVAGDRVEVLSGVAVGEPVLQNPNAAPAMR